MDQTFPTPAAHTIPAAVPGEGRRPIPRAGRVLGLAVGLGIAGQALFFGNAPGINVPIAVGCLLAGAWFVRPRGARFDPLDAPVPVGAVVFAGAAAVRAEPMLVAGDLVFAAGLALAALPAIAGVPVVRSTSTAVASAVGVVAGVIGIGGVWLLADTRPWSATTRRLGTAAGAAAPVLRGLAIAAPFLVLFALVFSAADAVFARILADALDWQIDLGDVPARAVLASCAAWLVGGALVAVAGSPVAREDGAATPDAASTTTAGARPRLSALEVAVALLAIDALFLVFVVLQGTYLFGGRDTVAAAGLTYAEYARRGFGEMIAAASVAGLLLLTLEAIVAQRSRVYVAAAVALVALTACVLLSAFWRLRLYQDAYGWTELRVYVIAAIAWLTLGLVAGAVALLTDRSRWMPHALVGLGLGVALVVTVAGPQRFSATQNVARALDPALVPEGGRTGLDAGYLATLGDDSVPVLVQALPRLADRDAQPIERFLARRRTNLATDHALAGWASWNLAREEARRALGLR